MTPRKVDPQEGGRLLIWFWTGSHSGALVGLELTEACHVCLRVLGLNVCASHVWPQERKCKRKIVEIKYIMA